MHITVNVLSLKCFARTYDTKMQSTIKSYNGVDSSKRWVYKNCLCWYLQLAAKFLFCGIVFNNYDIYIKL